MIQRGLFFLGLFLGTFSFSGCKTVVVEKTSQGQSTQVRDFSMEKLRARFDALILVRAGLEKSNFCHFRGEELALLPQMLRGETDTWAHLLGVGEGLPSLDELQSCEKTCRCGSWVQWLTEKGVYPSELKPGVDDAVRVARALKKSDVRKCAENAQLVCVEKWFTDMRRSCRY